LVWEAVPAIIEAAEAVDQADIVVVIGTSMQVYPAAGLVDYAKPDAKIYYIDPARLQYQICSIEWKYLLWVEAKE
jgi:NAD-dependent deacetylase